MSSICIILSMYLHTWILTINKKYKYLDIVFKIKSISDVATSKDVFM